PTLEFDLRFTRGVTLGRGSRYVTGIYGAVVERHVRRDRREGEEPQECGGPHEQPHRHDELRDPGAGQHPPDESVHRYSPPSSSGAMCAMEARMLAALGVVSVRSAQAVRRCVLFSLGAQVVEVSRARAGSSSEASSNGSGSTTQESCGRTVSSWKTS